LKGFKLNSKGDVEIKNNQIETVEGNELLRQTVQSVLGTNKGEWIFNPDEGINFKNILGKGVPEQQGDSNQIYKNEIAGIKETENELAEKLGKRLEGVLK
jgi:phage baseplate assembly protein W